MGKSDRLGRTAMNYFRTGLLLAAMTGLFVAIGYMLAGPAGIMFALIVATAMNGFAFWNADKLVLRMYGAREVGAGEAPDLVRMVGQLAQRGGLPMPRVYIVNQDQPNAFATGRSPDRAAVAVTTGLMRVLSAEETAGVIAHELAHIRNRDTLIMTMTAVIAGAIGMLANFAMFFGMFGVGGRDNNNPLGFVGVLLVAILAPIGAALVQMAISRTREYEADRIGAQICGQPLWLASALERLERGAQRIDNPRAEKNPASASMFIVNPLHAHSIDGLFRTHPTTGDRVSRLRAMAGDAGGNARRRPRGPWG